MTLGWIYLPEVTLQAGPSSPCLAGSLTEPCYSGRCSSVSRRPERLAAGASLDPHRTPMGPGRCRSEKHRYKQRGSRKEVGRDEGRERGRHGEVREGEGVREDGITGGINKSQRKEK